MTRKTITEEDAVALATRDEDRFFDRKALLATGRTVQKIGAAFANSDGGEFVIGIADIEEEPDAKARWKGAAKIEDFNPHIQALSEIKPSLSAEYSILDSLGRSGLVMLVRVEKSSDVHQVEDGTVYVHNICSPYTAPVRQDLPIVLPCTLRKRYRSVIYTQTTDDSWRLRSAICGQLDLSVATKCQRICCENATVVHESAPA